MKIKIEKFEGPLSLLLKMIEEEEMDITQINLAGIADQYIEYIKNNKNINPDDMADFLVIAAKLLFIKSKALLPYLYTDEDTEDADELERQLKMYKEFLEATKKIEKMLGKKKFMFAREFNRKVALVSTKSFSPPKKLSTDEMKEVFKELIMRIKPVEKLEEETLDSTINIEDKILSIQKEVLEKVRISFNKVLRDAKNKTEVIVSFLAVLEMMRQREVMLHQDELFTEIFITKWDYSLCHSELNSEPAILVDDTDPELSLG